MASFIFTNFNIAETYRNLVIRIENETCVNLPSKSIVAGLLVSLLCVLCMSIKMPHDAHFVEF